MDIYKTWPKLVKWFEGESGLTMHLHQVWDQPYPLLTFFSNHEMARITEDMWRIIGDLLDDMDYPEGCQLLWYLDRNLCVRVSVLFALAPLLMMPNSIRKPRLSMAIIALHLTRFRVFQA